MLVDAGSNLGLALLQLTRFFVVFILRNPPRFRALALFGRRPAERVARSSSPASENLHNSRHSQLPILSCGLT
jgi:hypothetical protein